MAGSQPTHVRLLANGESCSELVVVKGAPGDAADALAAEMKLALGPVQAATPA